MLGKRGGRDFLSIFIGCLSAEVEDTSFNSDTSGAFDGTCDLAR